MKRVELYCKNPFLPKVYALVDDEDYDLVLRYKWYRYTYNRTSYAKTIIGGKTVSMQNLVLPSPSIDLTPDHEDHNGLNNQKENLRLATIEEQRRNKQKHENSTSQYKGVSWQKERKKWVAQVRFDGKTHNLGRFNVELDAAIAYDKFVVRNKIKFAELNGVVQ